MKARSLFIDDGAPFSSFADRDFFSFWHFERVKDAGNDVVTGVYLDRDSAANGIELPFISLQNWEVDRDLTEIDVCDHFIADLNESEMKILDLIQVSTAGFSGLLTLSFNIRGKIWAGGITWLAKEFDNYLFLAAVSFGYRNEAHANMVKSSAEKLLFDYRIGINN